MSIGSRIKERREELGYTQPQLAQLVGVSKGTIGNYESNISSPNENILFKLFDVLKCDANFLYQDDIDLENFDKFSSSERQIIKKYRTLDEHGLRIVNLTLNEEYERCRYIEKTPVIELPFSLLKASAGSGDWLDDEQFDTISVQDKPEARKADIVIEVDGDSMLPEYANGDKVFVRLQPSIFENEIGIFIVNGSGFIKKMGKGELISTNPEFENIPINNYTELKCVGKVIGKV